MTENEALEELKTFPINCLDFKENQSLQVAIKALEEIQHYRAIGTVEELQKAINFKKYFMNLREEGLEVANWHKKGDLEPLDSFIDEACN